jgi:endonuclease/exonuclease/phosphatase family metal-dependent hydrolase
VRIVSYNILDGGTGRADPLAEVLLAQRADVVVLVEAVDPEVVERIGRRLGMDYVVGWGRERGGKASAVGVMSRWPIRWSVNHGALREGGPRGLVEARVAAEGGEMSVFGLHLHSRATLEDERVRMGEVGVLLDVTRKLRERGEPHVLAGDFNANSPAQRIDLSRVKGSTRRAAEGQEGVIPRDVVAELERQGYVDSLLAASPEAGRTAGSFTTQHPGQRVDFVFAFGVGVRSGWVETDRLAKYASDHYPVGAELAWR